SIVFLISFVLPQFQPLFENSGKELPLITRVLLYFGEIVAAYWWLIGMFAVASYFLFRHLLRKPQIRCRFERLAQKLPIVGALIIDNEVAQLGGTMAMLINNGTPLNEAIGVTLLTTRNTVTKGWLEDAEQDVREGRNLSQAFATEGFPKMACQLIAIGEETGKLGEMLEHVAQIHAQNVAMNTQRLLTILSPLLTIILGGVVAVIVGSLLATVMEINEFAF
ncbi:MAG: type II secretion system F family protein, partial [Sneathiella sp.]